VEPNSDFCAEHGGSGIKRIVKTLINAPKARVPRVRANATG
jgi:hypothetical protein